MHIKLSSMCINDIFETEVVSEYVVKQNHSKLTQ